MSVPRFANHHRLASAIIAATFLVSGCGFGGSVGSEPSAEISAVATQTDLSQTQVENAEHKLDPRGVPILVIPGIGEVRHPAWIALYALGYGGFEYYAPELGITQDTESFEASVAWLKSNLKQDSSGHFVWEYSFDNTYNDVAIEAPWSSAFAQAAGIQALVAHWRATGDATSLEKAEQAADVLFVPLGDGGHLFRDGDEIWFEEIPLADRSPHILNGHMRVLLALQDLWEATDAPRYKEWLEHGKETLLRWLPSFDTGYWLRYDLNPMKSELLFRFAEPYGFPLPSVSIDSISIEDPQTGSRQQVDVGAAGDAEGDFRIAGTHWSQPRILDGRSVRDLVPLEPAIGDETGEPDFGATHAYFYGSLPSDWISNQRTEPFILSIEYFDELASDLTVQKRSIAPGPEFIDIPHGDLLLSGSGDWRTWKIPIYPRDLGYWTGPIYGEKHAEYLSLLAELDPAFVEWAQIATAYRNSQLLGEWVPVGRADPTQESPIQTSLGKLTMQDGIPIVETLTRGSTFMVASPLRVARQALQDLEDMPNASPFASRAFRWLFDARNQTKIPGGVTFPYRHPLVYNNVEVDTDWGSSFGQAYVLRALVMALRNEHVDSKERSEIVQLAREVLGSYQQELELGGVRSVDHAGRAFFQEVPLPTYILNAHVTSIASFLDAREIPELQQQVSKLLPEAVASLNSLISLYDTGYWLKYDLNPRTQRLFQLDWAGNPSDGPLIESIALRNPFTGQEELLQVGENSSHSGVSGISGVDWSQPHVVNGRTVRSFRNGYAERTGPVRGGAHHNVFFTMHMPTLPEVMRLNLQPMELVLTYKDVAPGSFVLKTQSIAHGDELTFVPMRGGLLTMKGDGTWKQATVRLRPQDLGWFVGPAYQRYVVNLLETLSDALSDDVLSQVAEKQRFNLERVGDN